MNFHLWCSCCRYYHYFVTKTTLFFVSFNYSWNSLTVSKFQTLNFDVRPNGHHQQRWFNILAKRKKSIRIKTKIHCFVKQMILNKFYWISCGKTPAEKSLFFIRVFLVLRTIVSRDFFTVFSESGIDSMWVSLVSLHYSSSWSYFLCISTTVTGLYSHLLSLFDICYESEMK